MSQENNLTKAGGKRTFSEFEKYQEDSYNWGAFLLNGACGLVVGAVDFACEVATGTASLLTSANEEPIDITPVSESRPEVLDLTHSASPVHPAPRASLVVVAPLAIPVAPEISLPSDVQFEWPAVTKALGDLKETPKAFPGHSNQRKNDILTLADKQADEWTMRLNNYGLELVQRLLCGVPLVKDCALFSVGAGCYAYSTDRFNGFMLKSGVALDNSIGRWMRKCPSDWKFIRMPVNIDNVHWMTLELNSDAHTMRMWDSIDSQRPELPDNVSCVLNAMVDKMSTETIKWKIEYVTVVTQKNGYDCGTHTAMRCSYINHTDMTDATCGAIRRCLTWAHLRLNGVEIPDSVDRMKLDALIGSS